MYTTGQMAKLLAKFSEGIKGNNSEVVWYVRISSSTT